MSTSIVELASARLRPVLGPSVVVFAGATSYRVEGTGGSVVEVLDAGQWRAGGTTRALRPTLHVNILSDVTRDEDGLPIRDDADARAWSVWEQIDLLLHDIEHKWSAVGESLRSSGPTLTMVPNGDGSVLLSAEYELIY